jgi:hypothetical protein
VCLLPKKAATGALSFRNRQLRRIKKPAKRKAP